MLTAILDLVAAPYPCTLLLRGYIFNFIGLYQERVHQISSEKNIACGNGDGFYFDREAYVREKDGFEEFEGEAALFIFDLSRNIVRVASSEGVQLPVVQ